MWTAGDSDSSPHACHACALPDELAAQFCRIIAGLALAGKAIFGVSGDVLDRIVI